MITDFNTINDYNPCPETKLTEALSAGYALFWALLLLLPVHLFRTNPAFVDLPRLGPEWHWGLFCSVVGFWQLVALARRRPLWRWLGLALGTALWAGVSSCLAEGCRWAYHLPINTGCGTYAVCGLANFAAMVLLVPYVLADLSSVWSRLRRSLRRRSVHSRTNGG